MKKKKIKKQQKQKNINKLKKPINRYEKEIALTSSFIKGGLIFITAIFLWIMLLLVRLNADYNPKIRHEETIVFQKINLESYTIKGGYVSYYVITDKYGRQYELHRIDSFDKNKFSDDVDVGDELIITWYHWFGEKHIFSIESKNNAYRSYSQAAAYARHDGKIMLIFMFVSVIAEILLIFFWVKYIKKKRRLQKDLKAAKDKLNAFLQHDTES